MEIKVLGSGCATCKKLFKMTEKAIKELESDATVIHVTDMKEVLSAGVMSTPAIQINSEIKSSGRIPTIDEIKAMIQKG